MNEADPNFSFASELAADQDCYRAIDFKTAALKSATYFPEGKLMKPLLLCKTQQQSELNRYAFKSLPLKSKSPEKCFCAEINKSSKYYIYCKIESPKFPVRTLLNFMSIQQNNMDNNDAKHNSFKTYFGKDTSFATSGRKFSNKVFKRAPTAISLFLSTLISLFYGFTR